VNMSAKGYLKIEQQQDDLCSITQLQPESAPTLERERRTCSATTYSTITTASLSVKSVLNSSEP